MIPETQNLVTLRFKKLRAYNVFFVFRMLAAIEFDNQHFTYADEIDDVCPDKSLAAKFIISKAAATEMTP